MLFRSSPYYPASKMTWLLQNIAGLFEDAKSGKAVLGTVDSWLIYKMTGNVYTDCSNASRTQLMDLETQDWDPELCSIFKIPLEALPEITDSNFVFGVTDLQGTLKKPVPVCGVMGDSHAALFGHNCRQAGMTKATYGTEIGRAHV